MYFLTKFSQTDKSCEPNNNNDWKKSKISLRKNKEEKTILSGLYP